MADLKKVMAALELCAAGCDTDGCAYNEEVGNMECDPFECPPRCVDMLAADALELLKEKHRSIGGHVYWNKDEEGKIDKDAIRDREICKVLRQTGALKLQSVENAKQRGVKWSLSAVARKCHKNDT